jgi:Holliday junction resolvasome RuvABC DNA-binding subunit
VIAYLSGTVLQKFTKSLVLKIDSIGYEVTVSAPLFEKTSAGEKMELFIYTHVREDELSLYGFEKRVVKFNQVEPAIVEQQSEDKPKIEIPNPVVNVVSEKNLKQAADAGKLVSKSIIDLFKDYIFFSTKKEKKKAPAQLEKEAKQNANKRSFFDSLRQLGGKSKLYEARLKENAEQVSRKLGGNLSYEGTIQESMEVRIDIESLMDKKNSELNASELSAKRARAVQAASGGKSKSGHRAAKQEMNPEKGMNAGQRNAYTQAG